MMAKGPTQASNSLDAKESRAMIRAYRRPKLGYAFGTSRCTDCGAALKRRVRPGDKHNFCSRKCSNHWHGAQRQLRYVRKSPKNGQPWSEDDKALLAANYRPRCDIAALAKLLGRRPRAVVARITMLGLWKRLVRWTDQQDQFLRDHRDRGWPWCARQLGRPVAGIRKRAIRLGIQNKKLVSPNEAELRRLHSFGMTTTEIGEALGYSAWCILTHIRRLGLVSNKRSEAKRMASLTRTMLAKYGVPDIGKARQVRARQARAAAFQLQVASLGKALEAACPS